MRHTEQPRRFVPEGASYFRQDLALVLYHTKRLLLKTLYRVLTLAYTVYLLVQCMLPSVEDPAAGRRNPEEPLFAKDVAGHPGGSETR